MKFCLDLFHFHLIHPQVWKHNYICLVLSNKLKCYPLHVSMHAFCLVYVYCVHVLWSECVLCMGSCVEHLFLTWWYCFGRSWEGSRSFGECFQSLYLFLGASFFSFVSLSLCLLPLSLATMQHIFLLLWYSASSYN